MIIIEKILEKIHEIFIYYDIYSVSFIHMLYFSEKYHTSIKEGYLLLDI